MINLQHSLVFACMFFLPTLAFSTETVIWEQIDFYHNKEVQISGFLYKTNDKVILASKPNLRSCCLTKTQEHVIINDRIPNTDFNLLQTLQGKLVIGEGKYYLLDVHVMDAKPKFPLLSILALLVLVGTIIFYHYRKKNRSIPK